MGRSWLLILMIFSTLPAAAAAPNPAARPSRPHQFALLKAYGILPSSLRYLVKKNGKFLFEGLEQGLRVPVKEIDNARILTETDKITALIDSQSRFPQVIYQMGYVAGMLAIYTDPSLGGNPSVRQGFEYYLDYKLSRFAFVFDGYPSGPTEKAWLHSELARVTGQKPQYRTLLEKKYAEVNGNPRYRFDERSGVFGVCSIYFSNLARLSAHLWYYAWSQAQGDLSHTPFQGKKTTAGE